MATMATGTETLSKCPVGARLPAAGKCPVPRSEPPDTPDKAIRDFSCDAKVARVGSDDVKDEVRHAWQDLGAQKL